MFDLLLPKKLGFKVTPKGLMTHRRSFDWRSSASLLAVTAITLAAMAKGLWEFWYFGIEKDAYFFNLSWAGVNLIGLITYMRCTGDTTALPTCRRMADLLCQTFGDKPGQFKYPTMIAADHTGNVYVVDQHNHRVQKFDSSGKFILMWGKKGSGDGEFNYPYGIAVDSKGNVYVSDMNNNRVQKFSANGIYLASIGKYGTGDGEFKYPYGIAVGPNDIVYVIDAFNYRVQKFTAGLQFIGKWGSAESIGIKLYMPHEIAMTKNGEVILA